MKRTDNFDPGSIIETDCIGEGTNIYAFTHVMRGAVIGKNCSIGEHCFIESGVKIGDNVVIKNGCLIWEGVTICDDVFLGPGVILTNDKYPRSTRMKESPPRHEDKLWLQKILIKRGVTLGAGVIVVAGVEIGDYASVGAGSVVTKSIGSHVLVVGNPAMQIGWVCKCGMRLFFENDIAKCGDCRKTYKLAEEQLSLLND
jgi:UDP-2-acetamido-3-amino-2,3-dideoxy-glucuronate N-acetyltransferase